MKNLIASSVSGRMFSSRRVGSSLHSSPGSSAGRGRAPLAKAVSDNPLIESLESRLLMTTWNWNATLIHQDQAATNFPTITGVGESVVVMDTGAYNNHPSLTGKTILWQDFVGSTTTVNDTDGHGTAMTGTLAGNAFTFTDGTFGQGIAPGVNLIVLKTDDGVTNSWATQGARISNALDWVIANRATYNIVAINLSTGSKQGFTDTALTGDRNLALDQSLSAKFATLSAAGVFVGAAAGNDGATKPNTIEYPAADANVYSSSSVNSAGAISTYASRGVLNDVLAPGENIVAPYYFPADPNLSSTYYINFANGTSFTVPQMVGTAALIKQINPNFTPAQIMAIMKSTGTNVTDPTTGNTFPVLNINAALQMAEQMTNSLNNHSFGTATAIPFSGNVAQLSNLTSISLTRDFYSFNLPAGAQITFVDTAPSLNLYDVNGNLISNVDNGRSISLAAGNYFLTADGGATTTSYSITLQSTPTVIPPTQETPGANATVVKTAYDPYGRLCVAYYNSSTQLLKFAMRSADGLTWSAVSTIDSTPQAGQQLSLAIDPFGNANVAYYDTVNGRLKYAKYNGSSWTTSIVDANGVTGWQPSITFNSVGTPYIAYFSASTLDLRVASLTGSKWTITTVDSKGNVGFVPSIAYNRALNTIGVAYQDLSKSWYKYASTTNGKTWTLRTVDTTTNAAGGSLSLAFNAVNLPEMVYNDAYNLNLKHAKFNGSTWTVSQVGGNSHGMAANLKFNSAGNADVLFYNFFGGYSERATQFNGIWSNTPITTGGASLVAAVKNSNLLTLSWITNAGAVFLDL